MSHEQQTAVIDAPRPAEVIGTPGQPEVRYDNPTEQRPISQAPQPSVGLPQRVAGESIKKEEEPVDLGGPGHPDWSYLEGQKPVDGSNKLADSFGMASEVGRGDVDDTQLRPEDGMRVGADGQLHAANEPGSYNQPKPDAIMGSPVSELATVAPRQVAVRDLGVGATALQVRAGGSGNIYHGRPVQSGSTLYGGKLVGESYQGRHRIGG